MHSLSLVTIIVLSLLHSCIGYAFHGRGLSVEARPSFPVPTNHSSGRERQYRFEITRGFVDTDGINTSTLLVNGQYPGPTLNADWGDIFVVEVLNEISGPEAGTSIHWHGLFQRENPFMDGVPSITQCPIAPGGKITYRFRAERIGTSWWHSHFASQTVGGLFGAMIVRGPEPYHYDIDVGAILMNDRYQFDYTHFVDSGTTPVPSLILSDTNQINGRSGYDCGNWTNCTSTATFSNFTFQSGKTHLLRLINSGSEALEHFRIDGHQLRVVSLDYTPIQPYDTDFISLSPGQRANVLVIGTGRPQDSFWMRAEIDTVCAGAKQPFAKAIVHYENADRGKRPTTQAKLIIPYEDCSTGPLSLTTPLVPRVAPQRHPTLSQTVNFTLASDTAGNIRFLSNNRTFRANWNRSILAESTSPSFAFLDAESSANVYDLGSSARSIQMVLYNEFLTPHPMHLHGHDFTILAEGHGEWDGQITPDARIPMTRDTHQMLAMKGKLKSFVVIQFDLDNPGIWPLHCHISQHMALGMSLSIAYGKEKLERLQIPQIVSLGCEDWRVYVEKHIVDQPDSGLKFI